MPEFIDERKTGRIHFPDGDFPDNDFPGRSFSRQMTFRQITFPTNDFPDKPVNLYILNRKFHFKSIQWL
jgi:hypothetical protein